MTSWQMIDLVLFLEDEKKNVEADIGERQAPHDERAVTPSKTMEEGGEEETML